MEDRPTGKTTTENNSFIEQADEQFAYKKKTSFEQDTFFIEDESFIELLQPLDMVTRRRSHVVFQYRPEFVPKLKAKTTKICPSPMKLQRKKDNPTAENYLSDSKSSYEPKNTQPSPYKFSIRDMRNELSQIKSTAFNDKAKAFEHILINPLSLNKRKRRSFFSKAIKNYIEDIESRVNEDESELRNQLMIPPMKRERHYSILSILEYAAGNCSLCKSKSTLL